MSKRRFFSVCLLAVFMTFFLLPGSADAGKLGAAPGVLQGRVVDIDTQQPIAGALVTAFKSMSPKGSAGFFTTTDAAGHYAINNIPPNHYIVAADARGYIKSKQAVRVTPGSTRVVRFTLSPGGTLTGRVTDTDTALPIEGALVFIEPRLSGPGPNDDHHDFYDETDADGYYTIEDIPAGDYTAAVRARGYEPAEQDVVVSEGNTTTADFALTPLPVGSLAGTVTDSETGLPVEGAIVQVHRGDDDDDPDDGDNDGQDDFRPGDDDGGHGDGHHGFYAETDENGEYLIEGIPAGTYTARAWAMGYAPGDSAVEIFEGETATADFALDPVPVGNLTGTVTDADTADVLEGVFVIIFREDDHHGRGDCDGGGHDDGGPFDYFDETDTGGIYAIEDIPVGTYYVLAVKEGYQRSLQTAEILEDQTTTLDFSLEPR